MPLLEFSTLDGTGLGTTRGAVARRAVVTIALKCIVALDEVLGEAVVLRCFRLS
jgi:hypothetical protein